MRSLIKKKAQFKHFFIAIYTTEVIFQQVNCPSGTLLEGKLDFSGKNKQYSYKTEVSVAPTSHAIYVTEHTPGSISDLNIFHRNLNFHNQTHAKYGDENEIPNNWLLSSKYPKIGLYFMDKGYQGAQQDVRAIIPKKKPPRILLLLMMNIGMQQFQVIA